MTRAGDESANVLPGAWDEADDEAQLDPEALGALMASLRPVAPSAALREAVLSQVASADTGESGPGALGGPEGPAGPQEPAGTARPEEGAVVVPLRRRARSRGGLAGWRLVGMRAAAVVALVGVGVGVGRWSAMDSMAPTEHFAHLNQAQDVQRVTDTMPDGHIATLTWSQDMSMTALALPQEMMAASQGHSLQVWLVKDGVTTSLGLYDPSGGTGFTFIDLMPQEGERVFITQEPEGGSSQPTGEPLVTFDVNADGTTTRASQAPTSPGSEA
ncbi:MULTISPECIES: anti-sigma factor [unclassified Actinomyces]|uniref:anti-sigma factor n=1 Tax=unclassified Actinomyces TaxID=2609248 RepID=UPI002016E796|nr:MULTISPECIES: anti-sigma factor [unclassified Actinomyces]MCL3776917.1 anti-sigma factor [Actinomyces sp. AC-20-1]MCL3789154.1 anti-sigma factor [Actinomyces sp. 187325]MCL3792448.1 anti-sigma factor [Actinomyces sp. 186855]MCL3794225.1 anti-sigma factor [Actinomyces sp. 217892]